MDDIFIGADASSCDGDINMCSNMWYILFNEFGEKLDEPVPYTEFFSTVVE